MSKLVGLLFILNLGLAKAQFVAIENSPIVNDALASFGASWVDYDNDGDDDLFISRQSGYYGDLPSQNALFRNDGLGVFIQITSGTLVEDEGGTRGSAWGDYNNDNLIDVFIADQHETFLYQNEGNGVFTLVESIPTTSLETDEDHSVGAWGDYDSDGFLDLFVASRQLTSDGKNTLYRNRGDGTFEEIIDSITERSGKSSDACWIDYDNNGTLDLFVSNSPDPNYLYSNEGNGLFTEIQNFPFFVFDQAVGSSWADYDNDGDFDVLIQNNANRFCQLFENNNDGTFTSKENAITGVMASSSAWGDFDNDGWLDIIEVGSGAELKSYLFRNNGDRTFTDVSSDQGINNANYSASVAISDYNKDGFLDIFIANVVGNGFPLEDILYQNTPNLNNWIGVKLVGTISNSLGIGAKVELLSNTMWQFRMLQTNSGSHSQSSMTVHFGLGKSSLIDEILVRWPSGGLQVITNQQVNKYIVLKEPTEFPEAPSALEVELLDNGKVELNWNDNSMNESGFWIERAYEDNKYEMIAETAEGISSYTDTAFGAGGNYSYRVAAKLGEGISKYSNVGKVAFVTGISQTDFELRTYPNPTHDLLNIESPIPYGTGILTNTLGQYVKEFTFINFRCQVSISDLPTGIYTLRIGERRVKILKN